jgi:hypothetical protein
MEAPLMDFSQELAVNIQIKLSFKLDYFIQMHHCRNQVVLLGGRGRGRAGGANKFNLNFKKSIFIHRNVFLISF